MGNLHETCADRCSDDTTPPTREVGEGLSVYLFISLFTSVVLVSVSWLFYFFSL